MSLIKFLLAPTKALNLHVVKKIIFYLKFLSQGTNKYNIHSPMVHAFIENILDNSIKYYSFIGIEHVRSLLLKQNKAIKLKENSRTGLYYVGGDWIFSAPVPAGLNTYTALQDISSLFKSQEV